MRSLCCEPVSAIEIKFTIFQRQAQTAESRCYTLELLPQAVIDLAIQITITYDTGM